MKHINFKKVDWGKIITAVLITVISVTAWTHIKYRTNQAQVEKQLNQEIELKETKLNELNKTNEATSKEAENLKKETEELKKQLQAKREKQQADKVYAETLTQPVKQVFGGNCATWVAQAGITDIASATALIAKESGCDPNSINRLSGACGVAQELPCGKSGCSLGDGACQVRWMDSYIKARYGTWANALSFHRQNNWY